MKLRDVTNTGWGATTPKSRYDFRKTRKGSDLDKHQPNITLFFPSRKQLAIPERRFVVERMEVKRRKEAIFLDHDSNNIPVHSCSVQRIHSLTALQTSTEALHQVLESPEVFNPYSLELVKKPQIRHTAFGSISGETLCKLFKSMTAEQFHDKFILIDCRYPYEYNGGHIKYAINLFDVSRLAEVFYPKDQSSFATIRSKIPIFYCEFSQKRGPTMASHLRRHDRMLNEHNYPKIDYKEVYVVDRGYRKFFLEESYSEFCVPNAYVPMLHPDHLEDLKQYNNHRRARSVAPVGSVVPFRMARDSLRRPSFTPISEEHMSICEDDSSKLDEYPY